MYGLMVKIQDAKLVSFYFEQLSIEHITTKQPETLNRFSAFKIPFKNLCWRPIMVDDNDLFIWMCCEIKKKGGV